MKVYIVIVRKPNGNYAIKHRGYRKLDAAKAFVQGWSQTPLEWKDIGDDCIAADVLDARVIVMEMEIDDTD